MDYTPRHAQPFSLKEAVNFDVSVITEEITRLENSLGKLQETQEFLGFYLEATPGDSEIGLVLQENEVVIESQKERISILKNALTEKGVVSEFHCETTPRPSISRRQSSDTTTSLMRTISPEPPRQIENEEIEEADHAPLPLDFESLVKNNVNDTSILHNNRMTPVPISISPINEFILDLVNMLHHATSLEVGLRRAKQRADAVNVLDMNMNSNADPESDEDLELAVSDAGAITKAKEDRFLEIRQFHAELKGILNCLQDRYETPLEGVLSAKEHELAQRYGKQLISWFEGIRGHLIGILSRTSILLKEREERKRKRKEDLRVVQELLKQMTALRTWVMKTERKLIDVAEKSTTSGKNKMEPTPLLDIMDVDGNHPARRRGTAEVLADSAPNARTLTGNDLTALLEDTKSKLREFLVSRQTYTCKAESLHNQTTKVFQCAPLGCPLISVRNVEIDAIEVESIIRQIVVEETDLLYGHLFSSMKEEVVKKGEATASNLANIMADTNKVVCKLLVSCLGCDELGVLEDGLLNRRQDHPSVLDTLASLN